MHHADECCSNLIATKPSQPQPAWSAEAARAAIGAIVDDARSARQPDGGWPVHPRDEAGDTPPGGFKGLYLGRAGVLWALWTLERWGAVPRWPGFDWEAAIADVDAAYRDAPDSGEVVPSLYLGEAGILLARWRIGGDPDVAARLAEQRALRPRQPDARGAVGRARHDGGGLAPSNAPPATRAGARCSSTARMRCGARRVHDEVDHSLVVDPGPVRPRQRSTSAPDTASRATSTRCCSVPSGSTRRGATTLYERCAITLRATVRREGQRANWPAGTWTPRPGATSMLVQWCHGAPGFVTALAPFPPGRSSTVDEVLVAAGEPSWQAGPLTKGSNLCHGTAGNGDAFLALHARTGNAAVARTRQSLRDARASPRCEHARAEHGRGRYTLWTGDLGLALYLQQCIDGRAGMPTLDFL